MPIIKYDRVLAPLPISSRPPWVSWCVSITFQPTFALHVYLRMYHTHTLPPQPLVFRCSNEFEGLFPFCTQHILLTMGSAGWVRCYWCEQWVNNPYIGDDIAQPLCDDCYDHHWDHEDGEPRRPNAIRHRTNVMKLLFRRWQHDDAVLRHIASFLEGRYKPGAGSRRHPIMM